jgi:lipopolysaccharide biosynthesis regulator YciM
VIAVGIVVATLVVVLGLALVLRARQKQGDRRPPYIVALGALIDGDEDTALEQFRNAARLDSTNVDAYLRLGELFRRRGDATRAHQIHRELAARGGLSNALRARIQEALCRDHLALGRLERAAEAAREGVRLASDPAAIQQLLLDVAEQLGDHDEAFKVKREILRGQGRQKTSTRELADFRAAHARDLLEKGELKEAERVLREARRIDARSQTERLLWGDLKEREGDYGAAIEAWNSLLKNRPDDAETVFHSLERVHFLNGTFSDMEGTYNEYLEAVPAHEDAAFGLARFLRRKGQVEDAFDVCHRALDVRPSSLKLRVLCLALLLQSGRNAEAQSELNDWISKALGEEEGDDSKGPTTPDTHNPLIESSW